jgi:hypothetical protein
MAYSCCCGYQSLIVRVADRRIVDIERELKQRGLTRERREFLAGRKGDATLQQTKAVRAVWNCYNRHGTP